MLKPYLIMAVISLCLYALAGRLGAQTSAELGQGPFSIARLLKSVLTGFGGGALWYLYTFGLCEVIALCCSRFVRDPLVICAMMMVVLKVMERLGLNIHYALIIYFSIGYLVRAYGSTPPSTPYALLPIVLILFFVGFPTEAVIPLWALAVMAILFWWAKAISMQVPHLVAPLCFLGRHTLSILMFHSIISVALRPLVSRLLCIDPSGVGVSIVMLTLVTGLCLAVEMGIRRTKLRYLFFEEIRIGVANECS